MARRIMIQGTMSGAGKSILVTALCRIFTDMGFRTAPFKSQNMALNSFVDATGGEMGRAQVLQAQACRKEPDVRMNPVLLKPVSDIGSQVILNGKVLGNYKAGDYFRMKTSLVPGIMRSFRSLSEENDIIVIEGAGSPAEINLKKNDIVNMGLAALTDSPVLLAGDIDPGGVFAQLYGTHALLEESEKERLKGFIINKFRGDESLLRPGLDMLEEMTGVPVLGVVPYMDIDVDDEDSLSPRFGRKDSNGELDVAVVRLPHISNFTDIAPLERHPDIAVRYINDADLAGIPDAVIIPGTKNTRGDLKWMEERGIAGVIRSLAERGVPVLGICGGYQMLGEYIGEEEGTGNEGGIKGLGLLPVSTGFIPEKIKRRTSSVISAAPFEGIEINGYEIHNGVTVSVKSRECAEAFGITGDGRAEGCAKGNVFGTYIHGLFDNGKLTDAFAEMLLERKGIIKETVHSGDHFEHLEGQIQRIADTVRKSTDIGRIMSIMEEYPDE